jgi:hypothetical protein
MASLSSVANDGRSLVAHIQLVTGRPRAFPLAVPPHTPLASASLFLWPCRPVPHSRLPHCSSGRAAPYPTRVCLTVPLAVPPRTPLASTSLSPIVLQVWDPRVAEAVVALEPASGEVARDCWGVAFGNSHDEERVIAAGYDNGGALRPLPVVRHYACLLRRLSGPVLTVCLCTYLPVGTQPSCCPPRRCDCGVAQSSPSLKTRVRR